MQNRLRILQHTMYVMFMIIIMLLISGFVYYKVELYTLNISTKNIHDKVSEIYDIIKTK